MMIALLAAVCSWFFLLVLIPQLRMQLLDQPNSRSSHSQPTPRGGGVAFAVLGVASSVIAMICGQDSAVAVLPSLAAPLAVVGLLDDRQNLPASCRYVVQLFTAVLILGFSPLVQGIGLAVASGSLLLLPVLAFLAIAVTAVINFTNFMDGLDGLVAGCMAINIAALAYSLNASWPLWFLVGALLGFLLWNWSPAKVFMGDVGSTFLGAVFAGLLLQSTSWPQAFGHLLVATPLLGDACLCVARRLLAGQRVFEAHRLHLFQRLHQAGWPHSRVSTAYIAATALLAFVLLARTWPWVLGLAFAELLLGLWLDQRVAVPFSVASKS